MLVPSVPLSLAIVCGVLGAVMPVTRQAWLTIFMAAMTVPDLELLPVLCLVSLPVWLLVTDRPPMLIAKTGPGGAGMDAGVPAGGKP